jgi:NADPH:quinone reductase-like Zn-dependent oxidoreductase
MLSVRFDSFGEPAEVLHLEEVATPEPGPGEVLVRVRARPINPSDLSFVRGLYGIQPQLPATPEFEGAGLIEALGPEVRGVQPGQRVIPLGTPGTWQEYVVVKADQFLPTPEPLSDVIAAQFVVNPLTAWVMATEELALQPGQWLLQTAAGSTLGRVMLQIARLRGFKTINVVRRREQVAELKALGVDEVICTADEDLVARVTTITGAAGVPAAVDAVGGSGGGEVARALGPHGVMLVYGLLAQEPMPIDGGPMLFRASAVRGFWLSEWFQRTPLGRQRAVTGELLGLMATRQIVPPIEAEYALQEVLQAVQHAERPAGAARWYSSAEGYGRTSIGRG